MQLNNLIEISLDHGQQKYIETTEIPEIGLANQPILTWTVQPTQLKIPAATG